MTDRRPGILVAPTVTAAVAFTNRNPEFVDWYVITPRSFDGLRGLRVAPRFVVVDAMFVSVPLMNAIDASARANGAAVPQRVWVEG